MRKGVFYALEPPSPAKGRRIDWLNDENLSEVCKQKLWTELQPAAADADKGELVTALLHKGRTQQPAAYADDATGTC